MVVDVAMDGGQWTLPHTKNRLQASSYQGTRVLQVQEPAGLASFQAFFRRSGVSLAKVFELGHVCNPCTRHWTVYVRAGCPTNQLAAPFVTAL